MMLAQPEHQCGEVCSVWNGKNLLPAPAVVTIPRALMSRFGPRVARPSFIR